MELFIYWPKCEAKFYILKNKKLNKFIDLIIANHKLQVNLSYVRKAVNAGSKLSIKAKATIRFKVIMDPDIWNTVISNSQVTFAYIHHKPYLHITRNWNLFLFQDREKQDLLWNENANHNSKAKNVEYTLYLVMVLKWLFLKNTQSSPSWTAEVNSQSPWYVNCVAVLFRNCSATNPTKAIYTVMCVYYILPNI